MRWFSHGLIAGATFALYRPELVPVVVIGATAPDWLEKTIKKFSNIRLKHREETHYVVVWFALFAVSFFLDYQNILMAFSYGGLTHVFMDALTIKGVPYSHLSLHRFHLFGGRLVTGTAGEYITTAVIVLTCVFLFPWLHIDRESEFIPFFFNWGEFYEEGLIDGQEWKQNRFRFF